MQLYLSPLSPYGRKVNVVLKEINQIKNIEVEINLASGTPLDPGNSPLQYNPLGKIPVLICPNGNSIFETMAITSHLVEQFPQLAPPKGSYERDLQWQYLSLMGTSIYLAYHRQFYSHYYAPKEVSKEVGDKNWMPLGVQVCDGNLVAWNCMGGTMLYKP